MGPVSSRLDEVSGLQALVISMFRSMPRTGDVLRLPWWVSKTGTPHLQLGEVGVPEIDPWLGTKILYAMGVAKENNNNF